MDEIETKRIGRPTRDKWLAFLGKAAELEYITLDEFTERAEGILRAVKERQLLRSPVWNPTLPKEQIFDVWRQCFDPRIDIYYDDWSAVFQEVFGDQPRP